MGAYNDLDPAVLGLLNGYEDDIITGIAGEDGLYAGLPVFGHQGVEDVVFGAHLDQSTLTLSADLVADNVYTVVVNGTSIAKTYASSHASSMTALIALINANTTISGLGIVASAGTDNKVIILKGRGVDITATGAVTAGQSQASVTVVNDTWAKFMGVIAKSNTSLNGSVGTYNTGDAVNVLQDGFIYVGVSVAVEDKQPAYVIYAVTNRGKFTNSSSGTYDCGCYFRSNRANNMALLEVRGLK